VDTTAAPLFAVLDVKHQWRFWFVTALHCLSLVSFDFLRDNDNRALTD